MQDDSLIHYGNILKLLNCRLFLPGIGGSFCMSVFHHGILCKCPSCLEAFTKCVTENGVSSNEFT